MFTVFVVFTEVNVFVLCSLLCTQCSVSRACNVCIICSVQYLRRVIRLLTSAGIIIHRYICVEMQLCPSMFIGCFYRSLVFDNVQSLSSLCPPWTLEMTFSGWIHSTALLADRIWMAHTSMGLRQSPTGLKLSQCPWERSMLFPTLGIY